jgi:hypothetical protein
MAVEGKDVVFEIAGEFSPGEPFGLRISREAKPTRGVYYPGRGWWLYEIELGGEVERSHGYIFQPGIEGGPPDNPRIVDPAEGVEFDVPGRILGRRRLSPREWIRWRWLGRFDDVRERVAGSLERLADRVRP